MKTKVCTKCNVEKEVTEFKKDKRGRYGVRGDCKMCSVEQAKEYYKNNKEEIAKRKREYQNKRRKNDPVYRMIQYYRTRTWSAYTKNKKTKSTLELLGCTGIELANHLEKQFQPGMTHDNYGEWHIDHIKPIVSFDLSDPEQEQECFHYTNLQPLWASENLSKGAKYEQ